MRYESAQKLVAVAAGAAFTCVMLGALAVAHGRDPLPGMLPKKDLPVELKAVTAKTKVGSWVEYSVHNRTHGKKFRWRIALVGKKSKNQYWWEYTLRWGRLHSVILRVLYKGKKHDPKKIQRMIWKPGGHQAVEVPVKKGKKFVDFYHPAARTKSKRVGRVAIKVVGGAFQAEKYVYKPKQGKKSVFWTSKAVPILGLVKLLSPEFRLELIAYGQNARPQVTEKPGKLPFPLK
jgi:hypothetical protein